MNPHSNRIRICPLMPALDVPFLDPHSAGWAFPHVGFSRGFVRTSFLYIASRTRR